MDLNGLDDLYRDAIRDHHKNPRNNRELTNPDVTAAATNPFCGDEVALQANLDRHGRVALTGFQAKGCFINLAAGSMLTEALKGKNLAGVEALSSAFRKMMREGTPTESDAEALGELRSLSGVRQFPVRIKCALLVWTALDQGIEEHRRRERG